MTIMRVETDMLGSVEVPADALYGAHTVRAVANFRGRGLRVADRPELVRALAHVKLAAAQANRDFGVLDPDVAGAIGEAAREAIAGRWDDQFPLELVQGGGGTSTNMAMNEVLANRAEQLLGGEPGRYRLVHPFDDVNRSQSTNDVYPTAMALAAIERASLAVVALRRTARTLDDLAADTGDLVRLARTCLQDALASPAAAYHAAQARAVRRGAGEIERTATALLEVPLGATAVGTGAGAPDGYTHAAVAYLAESTGLPLVVSPDPFDSLAHMDPALHLATATASAVIGLAKIAADVRLLASGPEGGIGELRVPAVQVGSSIMPGKVNPVIPELVLQASYQIRGAAHVVESAVSAGELDLNVMEPVVAYELLGALEQLEHVADIFAERCLTGLRWNADTVREHLSGSLDHAVATALVEGHDHVEQRITRGD